MVKPLRAALFAFGFVVGAFGILLVRVGLTLAHAVGCPYNVLEAACDEILGDLGP